MRHRPSRLQHAVRSGLLAAALVAQGAVGAEQSTQNASIAQWSRAAQDWVNEHLPAAEQAPEAAGIPFKLRPEVEFGQLDPRLRLAPCKQVEPFLPAGTRLWGKARIGLRCVDGPVRWNAFLPVTIRVFGPAWTLRHPMAADTPLSLDDAELTETDWTEQSAAVLARQEDWVGQRTSRALMPGQALRQGMVRPPQVFEAGTQIKVVSRGKGFSVAATGEAITHGILGQTARVRMPSRKVISGTVLDALTIETVR